MERNNIFYKFLLGYVMVLQFLSRSVEAWSNNYTIIKIINSMNTSWKAGLNPVDAPDCFPQTVPNTPVFPTLKSAYYLRTPPAFDARFQWSHCLDILSRIRHQRKCGSCWAVGALSMLSDRTCIETRGTVRVHLSAEDVTTCCSSCGRPHKTSCDGASPRDAVMFWINEGIVTGGELGSREGCKPYSYASAIGRHQNCSRFCTNAFHPILYYDDKHFGKRFYRLPMNEEAIKSEIFMHGPVVASFSVFKDFRQYTTGVYVHKTGEFQGKHAIRLLGWGEEDGKKYWLAANSWGTGFGRLNGYIKFLRGVNQCRIEQDIIAARMFKNLLSRESLGTNEGPLNKGNTFPPSSVLLALIIYKFLFEFILLTLYVKFFEMYFCSR